MSDTEEKNIMQSSTQSLVQVEGDHHDADNIMDTVSGVGGDDGTLSSASGILSPPPPARSKQPSPPLTNNSNEDEHHKIYGIDDALPLLPPRSTPTMAVLPQQERASNNVVNQGMRAALVEVGGYTPGAHHNDSSLTADVTQQDNIDNDTDCAVRVAEPVPQDEQAVTTYGGQVTPGAFRVQGSSLVEVQPRPGQVQQAVRSSDNRHNNNQLMTASVQPNNDAVENDDQDDTVVAEPVPEDEQISYAIRLRDGSYSDTMRGSSFQAVVLDAEAILEVDPDCVRIERHPNALQQEAADKIQNYHWQRVAFRTFVVVMLGIGFGLGFGLSRGSDQEVHLHTGSTSNITEKKYGLYEPPIPKKVSLELSVARDRIMKGIFMPIEFSGNCSIAALSRIHATAFHSNEIEWAQTIQYDTSSDQWTLLNEELVNDMDERGNRFGSALAISNDGLIMAVAMPRSDFGEIPNTGSVRVYSRKQMNNKWTLLGSDLHGIEANEWMGTIVSLSNDGTMVAISSPLAYATRGCVRVYRYDEALNEWTRVGSEIVGDGITSYLTYVDLSAGNVLAIGAQFDDTTAKNAGSLKVFRLADDDWIQFGQSIYGQMPESQFGTNVQISRDGLTVAFSGFKDGSELARVYSYHSNKDEWIQKGNFDKVACVKLSADGERVIMCSLKECFIYSFGDENWKEDVTFDPIGFTPLDFTDDGKAVCGLTATGTETATISYYQLK